MNIEEQIEILNTICPLERASVYSKRDVRQNFFKDIQTEIQAYLLGFYVADGSLNRKRNTIRIKVTESDKAIVDLFAKFISPDARNVVNGAFDMIGTSGKEIHVKNSAQVDITCKAIADSLEDLGYGERKTYLNLHLPKLSDDLLKHFIRGYFDGDGCFTWHAKAPNIKNREKNWRVHGAFSWVSKTRTLLDELCEHLNKFNVICNVNSKGKTAFVLSGSSKESIKNLFNYLYSDCNFYFSRKYNKFNKYVNTEVTQLIAEYRNAQEMSDRDSNNSPTSVEHPNGMKMCAELTGNCEN